MYGGSLYGSNNFGAANIGAPNVPVYLPMLGAVAQIYVPFLTMGWALELPLIYSPITLFNPQIILRDTPIAQDIRTLRIIDR